MGMVVFSDTSGIQLTGLSTFALSRSPTFKLSTTGPRPFFLLHRTSLRPLTPADELCDLTGQMVGRGPSELSGDDHLGVAPAQSDKPDPTGGPPAIGVAVVVDFDPEGSASGEADAPAPR
jgi:hypothetical protein